MGADQGDDEAHRLEGVGHYIQCRGVRARERMPHGAFSLSASCVQRLRVWTGRSESKTTSSRALLHFQRWTGSRPPCRMPCRSTEQVSEETGMSARRHVKK